MKYDISNMNKGLILEFGMDDKRRHLRKVSKYRGKSEKFLHELENGKKFAEYILANKQYWYKIALENFRDSIPKNKKHKRSELKNGNYMHCRLSSIIQNNKLILEKEGKQEDCVIFSKKCVFEYICLLYQAQREELIFEFLDVPDVSYMTRMLAKTGIEGYFTN